MNAPAGGHERRRVRAQGHIGRVPQGENTSKTGQKRHSHGSDAVNAQQDDNSLLIASERQESQKEAQYDKSRVA